MQTQSLKSPLFIVLVLLQLAGSIAVLVLSVQFGRYYFWYWYAGLQIALGIMYLALDFNRTTRYVFAALTIALLCFWIFIIGIALFELALLDSDPAIPGKACSLDPNSPEYCPDFEELVELQKTRLRTIMGITVIGFVPSIVLFFSMLRKTF